ncbi:MAG: thiamine pyrophosphate-requiring protein, partial [Acidobacteria bacterium]|nr:thiamine pyrophosphate-requiring protein [Acidobacteriota bacterium]
NPQLLFWECSPRLPDGAIISADSGTSANWYARAIRIREGMKGSLSGTLATMCPGVPYATAAKFTHPDRVAVSFVGDGAMQMNGINGMITIAKYWKEWSNPSLIVCVLNNQDLNQVTWEQRVMGGDPKLEATQVLPNFPYAGYAESLGLKGIKVDDPERIASAWDEALRADRPVILEMIVDPEVPPLPPHITFEQAKEFATSIMKRDPHAIRMSKQSMKDFFAKWIPGKD